MRHLGRASLAERFTRVQRMTPGGARGRSGLVAPTPRPTGQLKTTTTPAAAALGRQPTVIVAALNSTDAGKVLADPFVGDGTAAGDLAAIQAAIDSFVSDVPTGGGRLLFLEGEWDVSSAPATIPNGVHLSIGGLGKELSTLSGAANQAIFDASASSIIPRMVEGLSFLYGIGLLWTHVDEGMTVRDCYFGGAPEALAAVPAAGSGDTLLDYYVRIVDNDFYGCGDADDVAVVLGRRVSRLLVQGNVFDRSGSVLGGLSINNGPQTDKSEYVRIVGNHFEGDVTIADVTAGTTITGNTFGDDLTVENIDELAIAANTCQGSYTQTSCTSVAKAGNVGIV